MRLKVVSTRARKRTIAAATRTTATRRDPPRTPATTAQPAATTNEMAMATSGARTDRVGAPTSERLPRPHQ